jgi:hypothetical protein
MKKKTDEGESPASPDAKHIGHLSPPPTSETYDIYSHIILPLQVSLMLMPSAYVGLAIRWSYDDLPPGLSMLD